MYEVCIVFDYKLPIYRARYFGANTMLLSMIPPRSSNQDLWAFAWLVLVISLYFTLNYPLASDEYVLLFSRGRKDFTAALATHSIIMPNICRISVNCFAIHSLNGNVKKYGRICNNRNPRKIGERLKKKEKRNMKEYDGSKRTRFKECLSLRLRMKLCVVSFTEISRCDVVYSRRSYLYLIEFQFSVFFSHFFSLLVRARIPLDDSHLTQHKLLINCASLIQTTESLLKISGTKNKIMHIL